MGIFAGLTASAFRQEGDDIYLLAPGKPRRYLSYEDYEQARSRLETMYMIGLPLIVVLVGVGRQAGYIWTIAGSLVMLTWLFVFGLPILKRNTVTGDIEDGVGDRIDRIATGAGKGTLIAGLLVSLGFVGIGLMMAMDAPTRLMGIACAGFFGLGVVFFSVALMRAGQVPTYDETPEIDAYAFDEESAVGQSRSAQVAKFAIAAIIIVGLVVSLVPLLTGKWSGAGGSDIVASPQTAESGAVRADGIDPELDRACLVVEYMRTVSHIGGDYTVGQVTREMLRGSKTGTARWEAVQGGYIWHLEKFDPLTKQTTQLAIQFEPDSSPMGQSVKNDGNYCGPLVLRASRGLFDGQELEGHSVAEAIMSAVNTLKEEGGASGSNSAAVEPVAPAEPIEQASDAQSAGDSWQNKPGKCRLVVDGVRHIEGQCDVALIADGSFKIVATNGYAAMVDREGSTAEGSWNGDPESMYLGEELGNLTRRGACWVNERAEICAWE